MQSFVFVYGLYITFFSLNFALYIPKSSQVLLLILPKRKTSKETPLNHFWIKFQVYLKHNSICIGYMMSSSFCHRLYRLRILYISPFFFTSQNTLVSSVCVQLVLILRRYLICSGCRWISYIFLARILDLKFKFKWKENKTKCKPQINRFIIIKDSSKQKQIVKDSFTLTKETFLNSSQKRNSKFILSALVHFL